MTAIPSPPPPPAAPLPSFIPPGTDLVISDEGPLWVRRERRLAGAGEAEEERHVAGRTRVAAGVQGEDALRRGGKYEFVISGPSVKSSRPMARCSQGAGKPGKVALINVRLTRLGG